MMIIIIAILLVCIFIRLGGLIDAVHQLRHTVEDVETRARSRWPKRP